VEEAIHSMGQALARVGHPDPCLNNASKLNFRLQQQFATYQWQDPPPYHVKPILLPLLQHAATITYASQHPHYVAIADMLVLGFSSCSAQGNMPNPPPLTRPHHFDFVMCIASLAAADSTWPPVQPAT